MNKQPDEIKKVKRPYIKPDVTQIEIDHQFSLVMMSESTEPPPENIGLSFNPLKLLR